jgi:hypothetical protein
MDMSVVVTHRSWAQRMCNSVTGALVGLVLFVASFALLGWNEARSVAELRALNECGAVLRRAGCAPAAADEGALVHVACELSDVPDLVDAQLGAAAHAPFLERRVQAYQWQESSDQQCNRHKVRCARVQARGCAQRLTWTGADLALCSGA